MFEQEDFERGWDYYVSLAGSEIAYNTGNNYAQMRISEIVDAINKMESNINNHPHKNNTQSTFQGYVAEEWSAGTFNVNAAAVGSNDYATAIQSNGLGSVDVQLKSGKKYSMKSYSYGEESARQQARINTDTGRAYYEGQERWVPQNQLESARNEAHKRMLKNKDSRPEVSNVYGETENKLTDRIVNDEGIESNPVTRKQLNKMATEGKKGEFSADDYEITVDNALKLEYVLSEALKAGYTAAAMTFAFQMAPEIYKCLDYLIKNGELNLNQIKKAGQKAFSSSTEGFLNGTITCALTIMLEKGSFGESLKSISGTWIGMTTSIVLETIKDSLCLATGKITAREMGFAFIDRVAIGVGFTVVGTKVIESIVSTKMVSMISGAIGQILGFEIPVMGYIIGSLVGGALATVYNFGKNRFLSICAETGFTCFGLVNQNYELPVEYLKKIGIEIVLPDFIEPDYDEPDYVEPDYIEPDFEIPETIEFYEIKRGVIGVNKIGYIVSR